MNAFKESKPYDKRMNAFIEETSKSYDKRY